MPYPLMIRARLLALLRQHGQSCASVQQLPTWPTDEAPNTVAKRLMLTEGARPLGAEDVGHILAALGAPSTAVDAPVVDELDRVLLRAVRCATSNDPAGATPADLRRAAPRGRRITRRVNLLQAQELIREEGGRWHLTEQGRATIGADPHEQDREETT